MKKERVKFTVEVEIEYDEKHENARECLLREILREKFIAYECMGCGTEGVYAWKWKRLTLDSQ